MENGIKMTNGGMNGHEGGSPHSPAAGVVNGLNGHHHHDESSRGSLSGHGHGGALMMGADTSSSSAKENLTRFNGLMDERPKRKAKRTLLLKSKETVNGGPTITVSRHLKNSRKSRNGFGRGLPKKGGAGGKGTWGAYGSDIDDTDFVELSAGIEAALDYKDPNYDSESLDNGDIHLEAIIPAMTDEELQKHVEGIILEYFEHGDTGEVLAALEEIEINVDEQKQKVMVIAVEAAMDHKPSHREMTSVLISELSEEILSPEDVAKAFEILLANLPDLVLDTPDAATVLGNFIARAVADDCIAINLVHSWKDNAPNEDSKSALAHAEVLLVDKIGILRLNNVWGVGGGAQPVKALTRQMHMLLKEFISSYDVTEAARCLKELEVPHFHHEVVYEAIVMAIESMSENVEDLICRLMKSLAISCILTQTQLERGFLRAFEDLPDIVIDVPAAYSLLDRFVIKAHANGIVTDELVRNMPIRGRKRFVSEGDGGKVKEDNIIQNSV